MVRFLERARSNRFSEVSGCSRTLWILVAYSLLGPYLVGTLHGTEPPSAGPATGEVTASEAVVQESVVAEAAASAPGDVAPVGDAATEPQARRQEQTARSVASAQRNIWWNRRRVIDNLKLSETQRQTMDGILEAYLHGILQQRPQGPGVEQFRAGLLAGDLAAARRGLEVIGDVSRSRGMEEGEMMLDVLGLLSPQQLETFRRRHPRLLQRSWLKVVGGGKVKAGQRRPQAGGGPPASPGGGG